MIELIIALVSTLLSICSITISVISLKRVNKVKADYTRKMDVLIRATAQHEIFISDVKKKANDISQASKARGAR